MFTLEKSEPGKPLLLHEEPIYLDGTIVGITTSGNYSFNFNKNMSFGYINNYHLLNDLKNKTFDIEVANKKSKANLELKALHNQKTIMIKA